LYYASILKGLEKLPTIAKEEFEKLRDFLR